MACFVSSLPLSPPSCSSTFTSRTSRTARHPGRPRVPTRPRTSMAFTPPIIPPPSLLSVSPLLLADISQVNRGPLFATAFVFFLTFWGSISFVKGSTKDRITQASFTLSEPASDIAKKTARYLMKRSFVADPDKDPREGVMTFTGQVRASSSVAAILVAVAASALWAATYILNFVLPPSLQSDYWWLLTLASFAVVPWYWKQANRTEEVKVMVEEEDDYSVLYLKGHRDEIEELEKAFSWKRNEPVYEDEKEKKTTAAETSASS